MEEVQHVRDDSELYMRSIRFLRLWAVTALPSVMPTCAGFALWQAVYSGALPRAAILWARASGMEKAQDMM